MSDMDIDTLPGTGQPITVSDRAFKQIAAILEGEGEGTMLRVAVQGGGCSGFQYAFTLDDTAQDDDLVIERDGVAVLIGLAWTEHEYIAHSEARRAGCGLSQLELHEACAYRRLAQVDDAAALALEVAAGTSPCSIEPCCATRAILLDDPHNSPREDGNGRHEALHNN